MCVMEAAAYLADEPWSDAPQCVSPVIAAFARSWNDSLRSDEQRTRLLAPLISTFIGTRTNAADEETRAWMCTDWLVRVQAPAWLDLAGLRTAAARLRALPPLTNAEIAIGSQSVLAGARAEADAAWAAAVAAARTAARTAAGAAAVDAAWAAAWAAAGAAAGAAAVAAARTAARTAARAAAWAAAGAVAGDAAWAAAGAAADKRLEPTVVELQASAVELLRRMCAVGRPS
jgi:hypothetical protein